MAALPAVPRTSARVSTASGIVSEVLTTAENLEKQDLNAKLGELSKKIEQVKGEMTNALQEKYVDFSPNLKAGLDLCRRVDELSVNMTQVTNKVDTEIKAQLNLSTVEFEALTTKLEESKSILVLLDKLVKIYDKLTTSEEELSKGNYEVAAQHLSVIDSLLKTPVNSRETNVAIIRAIKKTYCLRMEKLIQDLGESWLQRVKWTLPEITDDQASNKRSTKKSLKKKLELQFSQGEADNAISLESTIRAMYMVGILEPKLKSFGGKLIEYILKPLLSSSHVQLHIQSHSLTLLSQTDKDSSAPLPQKAMEKIQLVMIFLYDQLLHVPVKRCEGDGSGEGDEAPQSQETMMGLLGKVVGNDVLELIVKDCLASSIPSGAAEFESFSDNTVEIINQFEGQLRKLGFIQETNTVLSSFVNDVDLLFANKKTQEILQKARVLMTSEIHNSVKVGSDQCSDFSDTTKTDEVKKPKTENVSLPPDKKLSSRFFQLPSCYISASVEQLMNLAYETLHEASNSKPQCAIQLFYTVRTLFELYSQVVPTYHKDNLVTLPQLSALYHNNSMYLAHHLMTLGHQFRSSFPHPLKDSTLATLVDLVPRIRGMGTEYFIRQINRQKTQLIESLGGAQGFVGVSETDSYQQAERAICQVLHQLTHLKRVWMEILPHSIYCKSIGCLLNTVLVEVVNAITALEDISADDANMLTALLIILTDKAPELFKSNEKDSTSDVKMMLHKNVGKWQKLLELKMVLDASLLDISDRWADGKGPLAEEFTANEVKQLIRALFQNTDRRAAVLAKIK